MSDTRVIHTDLNVLLSDQEWDTLAADLPRAMADAGYWAERIDAEVVDLTCEPDNVLVNQYESIEGRTPLVPVQRIVVNGTSDLTLREATRAVVAQLPEGAYWYGTSGECSVEPSIAAVCAWQHP